MAPKPDRLRLRELKAQEQMLRENLERVKAERNALKERIEAEESEAAR